MEARDGVLHNYNFISHFIDTSTLKSNTVKTPISEHPWDQALLSAYGIGSREVSADEKLKKTKHHGGRVGQSCLLISVLSPDQTVHDNR